MILPSGIDVAVACICAQRRCQGFSRQTQVLRQHVACAERNHAEGSLRPRHALDHLENCAVAAADEDCVEAARYRILGLFACRVRGERVLHLDHAARASQQLGHAIDRRAPATALHQQRIEKEKNTAHVQKREYAPDSSVCDE